MRWTLTVGGCLVAGSTKPARCARSTPCLWWCLGHQHGVLLAQRAGFVDPATKQPPTVNVHRARLDGLLARGVHLAVCQMATRNHAGMIAKAAGSDTDAVYKELVANLLSNAHMVSAGVVAVNRAQERGYSFVHAG